LSFRTHHGRLLLPSSSRQRRPRAAYASDGPLASRNSSSPLCGPVTGSSKTGLFALCFQASMTSYFRSLNPSPSSFRPFSQYGVVFCALVLF
jgi:hypothetical protein